MKAEYREWIARWVAEHRIVYGMCIVATKDMALAFPELLTIRGYAGNAWGGGPEHAWCVTANGEVIDPTVAQFDEPFTYVPWTPDMPVYLGRCRGCGMSIHGLVPALDAPGYERDMCGDSDCAEDYRASIEAECAELERRWR